MTKVDLISTERVEDSEESFLPYYLGRTPEEAEETYKEFEALLNIMVRAYAQNSDVLAEDYFGEAVKGLARAQRDFDPNRGDCKFETFARLKIKNALNEYYRRNSSIVNIPHYVRTAHTYITNIKTIMEGYGMSIEDVREHVLKCGEIHKAIAVPEGELRRVQEELDKLKNVSKSFGVNYENLITRAEFVPSDMAYDETMTQEELQVREKRRLAAALVVSKLQDDMTEEELHVANGIMAGKTYAEIGRTHEPKRSIAWVQKKLEEMKEKFRR